LTNHPQAPIGRPAWGRRSDRHASDDAGAYPFDYECANATGGEVNIVRLPGFDVELRRGQWRSARKSQRW
jgi:hypothetical protein